MKHRPERVANLIKEELSKIISRELEFSGYLVTITDVVVNNKLERAIIKFSVLPSGPACRQAGNSETAFKILEKNRGYLQHLLVRKINIKPMPKIAFEIDRGPEKLAKIEKILIEDKMKE